MKLRLFCITFLTLLPALANDQARLKTAAAPPHTVLGSLLPRAFQKNPEVNCNVITEVMPAGKKLKPPTANHPVYYILQPGWYQSLGEITRADSKPPSVAALERLMKDALKTTGYLESTSAQHLPTLAVVFSYGDNSADNAETEENVSNLAALTAFSDATRERSLARKTKQDDSDPIKAPASGQMQVDAGDLEDVAPPPPPPEADLSVQKTAPQLLPYVLSDRNKIRQVIGRAALVGGGAFAKQLSAVLKDEAAARNTIQDSSRMTKFAMDEAQRQATTGWKSTVATWHGYDASSRMEFASPFNRFYGKDPKTTHLIDEAFSSCYFVVATAYDGAAIGNGERRVLWRTKMTVNSLGVGMADVLPAMIATAAPYFGHDMTEPVTVSRRIVREGKVELGTPTTVEALPAAKPPASE